MPQTSTKQMTTPVDENKELGFGAMLLAEGEDGGYEPVAVVSTISEAREIADGHLEIRLIEIEKGKDPMYPARYVVWVRGDRGLYRNVFTFEAD
jgi:hypothetical protein